MNKKTRLLSGLVAFAGLGMFANSANAYVVDFATAGISGGVMQCAAGNCIGINIPVNILSWDNTGDNNTDGTMSGLSLLLNFDTAANVITISGTVGTVGPATLLSGSFNNFDFSFAGGGAILSFIGNGPDTKNADLLALLGIPTDTSWEYGTFQLGARQTSCPTSVAGLLDATCYSVTSGDTLNVSVPEPGSLALLGLGLLGVGAARRRKLV